jgi:hypothetical protein
MTEAMTQNCLSIIHLHSGLHLASCCHTPRSPIALPLPLAFPSTLSLCLSPLPIALAALLLLLLRVLYRKVPKFVLDLFPNIVVEFPLCPLPHRDRRVLPPCRVEVALTHVTFEFFNAFANVQVFPNEIHGQGTYQVALRIGVAYLISSWQRVDNLVFLRFCVFGPGVQAGEKKGLQIGGGSSDY